MLVKFKVLNNWGTKAKKKFSRSRNFGSLTMCKKCYTFYYKHSWHFYKPKQFDSDSDSVVSVHFIQCPSCLEENSADDSVASNANSQYETEDENLSAFN